MFFYSTRAESKFESSTKEWLCVGFPDKFARSTIEMHFDSGLESAFRRTKAGYRVCNELSDLLPTFSLRVCGSFVGVIFGGRRCRSRRFVKLHFRYALAECEPSAGEPYCFRSRFRDRVAAAVNPVTTTVITYCFIAGPQLLTRRRSPVRAVIYV